MRLRGPNNVGRAVQTDLTLLPYASGITEQKKFWELLAKRCEWFQTLRNNSQQRATTCNRVCKRTRHVTCKNFGSWWPAKLRRMAWGLISFENVSFFSGVDAILNHFACLSTSKRSALKISWWQDKRENKCVTFLTCSPFTTMLTNQNREERKFCRHSRWKNVEIDSKKTFHFTPKLLLIIIYKFHNNGSGHFIFKLKSVYEHIKIIYVNCGVKNYLKEDHRKRICDDLPSNN